MGLLDSIARRAINKAVGSVVDQAIDSVFGDNNTNQQAQQPTVSKIFKPNLNGVSVDESIYSRSDWKEYHFRFEKTDKMYESSSGAAEVPIYYIIADSEDEAYKDTLVANLPELYVGDDDIETSSSAMLRNASNLVVTDVEDHGYIKKKYEFDIKLDVKGMCHVISYKFFVNQSDASNGIYTVLALQTPKTCSQEQTMYAIQSLNLVASTMIIEE